MEFLNDQNINQFKRNIETLIDQNNISDAKQLIEEFERKYGEDIELYSFKGIIAFIEGDLYSAESLFNEGIKKNPLNFDLQYNLAYLYESKGNYLSAYRVYKRLFKISSGEELLTEIEKKLKFLEKRDDVISYLQRKKVLIIAYIFPPLGGSGVQRTLKFVKYLREYGWEPVVVTCDGGNYPIQDQTLLLEVPEDIEVIRISEPENIDDKYLNKIFELQYGIVQDNNLMQDYIKILNKANSLESLFRLLQFPDNSITFAKEVIENISELIDINEIDLIYSTSGPYSDHIIAYYLKQNYLKPWIADFRDEWTNNPYIQVDEETLIYKINRSMEKNILNKCDRILTISSMAKENYIKGFNISTDKIFTITNGYDEADFIKLSKSNDLEDKFRIMHNGIFYMIRTPETFLVAVKNLLDANLIDRSNIDICFTYIENDKYWKEYVERLELNDIVNFLGTLSHHESLQYAMDAHLLLLVVGPGEKNKSVYTGKIFEYLRLSKRILSLSPQGSLVEKLIEETNRGKNVDFNDIEGIENYILKSYESWLEEKQLADLDLNDKVKKFERKQLTEQLSKVFYGLLNSFGAGKGNYDSLEKNMQFYDEVYKTGGWNEAYFKHYSETHYIDIWIKAKELIKAIENPKIIDIGCGPGQFANLLFDNNLIEYRGIDFSEEAIKYAKIRNDKYRSFFEVDNIYTTGIFNEQSLYNTVVIFEVLEHLEKDLEILRKLKSGAHVLFSVPNFYSPGHIRWFNSKIDVAARYKDEILIDKIYVFPVGGNNKIYLVYGEKK